MLSDTHLVFKFWFPLALALCYVRVCVHESVCVCVCTTVSVCHRQIFDSIQKILSTGDTTWIEKMRASHAYIMMITRASKWLLCRTQSTVVCLETRSPICVIFRLINAKQSNKSERKYHFLRGCCFSPNRCHRNVCARAKWMVFCCEISTKCPTLCLVLYIYLFFSIVGLVICDLILWLACFFVQFWDRHFLRRISSEQPVQGGKKSKRKANEYKQTSDRNGRKVKVTTSIETKIGACCCYTETNMAVSQIWNFHYLQRLLCAISVKLS